MEILPLEIETRPMVMDYLRRFPPEVSELTFTNLFAWRKSRPVWIVEQKNVLVFVCRAREGMSGRYVLGPPVGGNPDPHMLRSEIPDLLGYIRITKEVAALLERAGLIVSPDDNNSDYVYRTADLANLKGEKYHKKRNLIRQCLENHNCRYVEITQAMAPDCIATLDKWCFDRRQDITPDMAAEYRAIREMFNYYHLLELSGGAVLVNGCLRAYAVGEQLSPDTAVCHFEKAASEVKGLSQLINHWFAANSVGNFEYLNREEDLGIPGLRQAKRSYYPHHMVSKFEAIFPGVEKPGTVTARVDRL